MPRKSVSQFSPTPAVTASMGTADVRVAGKKTTVVVWVLGAMLVGALGAAGYFYYQYQNTKPGAIEAKEVASLMDTLGSMIYLPEGEEPTLATVTDKEKLAEQSFFQKAENGDKVLIYSGSGRAILYRPSTKKIVDVTSVNVQAPPQSQAPSSAPSSAAVGTETTPGSEPVPAIVRVALYNGSTVVGATNTVEARLRTILPNAAVVTKENAKKNDYPKTIVVDLSGSNGSGALSIASALGGEVGSLPAGESAPADADILVIIGKDK